MRVITQDQLDERYQRVSDCAIDGKKEPFHRPLSEYDGKTLLEKIGYKNTDEMNRLRSEFEKIQNPTEADKKSYQRKLDENKEDFVTQLRLVSRHDKNKSWLPRMQNMAVISCLSAVLTLYGGVVSAALSKDKASKNPITMTFGTICALSTIATWGGLWEMRRLEKDSRSIKKNLMRWHTLSPSDKDKVREHLNSSHHMGFSGFLETFTY